MGMKKMLANLFARRKKRDLFTDQKQRGKRKSTGRVTAEIMLKHARHGGADFLADTLLFALDSLEKREALFGSSATTSAVGLAIVVALERYGSKAMHPKKCKKAGKNCTLSTEHEHKLLSALRDIQSASGFKGKSPIQTFLEDWDNRDKN